MDLNLNKEFIICAAIWINDHKKHKDQPDNITEGFVLSGRRHGDCYQAITSIHGDHNEYLKTNKITDFRDHQGFMTSHNRYVNRKEAWGIALDNNQVVYGLKVSDLGDESILISENLY